MRTYRFNEIKSIFQPSKQPVLLTIALFLWTNLCLPQAENNSPELSFIQQFQLDFINQELRRYPDLFIKDWNTSSSARLIIESAELAVQNSPPETRQAMKERIIDLFAQIEITIQFTSDNLINKVDSTTKNPLFDFKDTSRHRKLKKRRVPQKTAISTKLPELQKIKGARRTLRRIKKKQEEQEKAAKDLELAEIRRNAALKEFSYQRTNRPYDTIDVTEFSHNRLAQEHMEHVHEPPERTPNEPIEKAPTQEIE